MGARLRDRVSIYTVEYWAINESLSFVLEYNITKAISSHIGIPDNEQADTVAKNKLKDFNPAPLKYSITEAQSKAKTYKNNKGHEYRNSTNKGRELYTTVKEVNRSIKLQVNSLDS
ncbi:hypothetical protein CHS0354_030546 [Potamilus streckersoni]|uniref:Uncharacterized protein n=1 Tax=Potamilus streckersoni TaxID=2493646 RepID=A0AAE0VGY7_9BIVA|nr:hypothetical protein CHS0354_030546 [Potamilus streckersoni]